MCVKISIVITDYTKGEIHNISFKLSFLHYKIIAFPGGELEGEGAEAEGEGEGDE